MADVLQVRKLTHHSASCVN